MNPSGACIDKYHYSASQKYYNSVCIPETHDCCSASKHCFPGNYYFFYEGQIRCCPERMKYIYINGEVAFKHTFY